MRTHRRGLGRSRRAGRGERGVALVELALVIPMVAMMVLTAVDLGRTAQYQNRMLSAAREGAMLAQLTPAAVDSGCRGDRNITDRTNEANAAITQNPGYSVTVAKKTAGSTVPYTGCTVPSDGLTVAPGDHVVVTVTADITMSSPISTATIGRVMHLSRSVEVVVQG